MLVKKIREIAKVRRGASPRPIDDPKYFGGEVGWIRIADVTASNKYLRQTTQYVSPLGESLSVRVDRGDLIMSIAGTVGRPIIVDIPACIHDGFVQIYDLKNTNVEYLYYFLKHIEKSLQRFGQSGTQVNLNSDIVGSIEVNWLPKPEQTRIAEILTTVDEAIAATEKLIAKYQRIKTGLMQDLLTRGIDENGAIRSKATHRFVVKKGIEVPEEWDVVPASELLRILNGGTPSTAQTAFWEGGAIPWLSVEDFNTGKRYVHETVRKITPLGLKYSATQLLPENSLIISARGTVGMIAQLGRPMAFNQSCYGLISRLSFVTNDFLFYALRKIFSSGIVSKSGSVFDTITKKTFDEILVPFPLAGDEINKIVELLTSQENLIECSEERLLKLYNLKVGLMQDLLTGKVRVPIKEEAACL